MSDTIYTFLSQIAPALVVLLGVLLTLRKNQQQFETNLREEREKAREEREFLTKHKAILTAAETVTRFIDYYNTLPDRELPKDGTIPEEIAEMSIALNRLHFYCDIETIRHTITMSQMLSAAYMKALKVKMHAMFISEHIKAVDIRIDGLEKINNQFQQEILALLSSAPASPLIISHRQQLTGNYENIAELNSKKKELIKEKYQATETCRNEIRKDLKEVYKALQDVLLVARKELDFPIDESEYATMLNEATELSLANIATFFDEIRAEITQKLGELD